MAAGFTMDLLLTSNIHNIGANITKMEKKIDTNTPTADHVMQILDSPKIAWTVLQACELQLFDELEKATVPPTAQELAQQKKWEPDGLTRLLDMMVAVKLVEKCGNSSAEDTYRNTPAGRMLIKDGHPKMYEYAMMVADDIQNIQQLAQTIKKGPVAGDEVGESSESDPYGADFPPELQLKTYRMLEGIARPYADQVVSAVDLSRHKAAVDLGGGSGVFSYALLHAYPSMTVILAELPSTITGIQENFISKNPNSRLSIMGLDYNKDTLPSADLYLLANVIHDHEPPKVHELLTKVHKALHPGGAVMLIDQLINDHRDGPPLAHAMDLAFYGMARMYTGKEYAAMLDKAHFNSIQIVKTQECCTSDIVYACKIGD